MDKLKYWVCNFCCLLYREIAYIGCKW